MPLRPDANQLKLSAALAKEAILKFLPIREFWFSQDSLEYRDGAGITKKGEVGKLVEVLSTEIGALNAEIRNSKNNFFLATAEGAALDAWGSDIRIARQPVESDEAYRTRILNIITKEKLSTKAVGSYLGYLTGISLTVFEPWRQIEIRDNRQLTLPLYKKGDTPSPEKDVPDRINSRSGKAVRSSSYWQAGVLDIISEGYAPIIRNATFEVVALGVKTFFTVNLKGDIGIGYPDPEEFPPIPLVSLESTKFVKRFIADLQRYSGTYPRSGNKESYGYTELFYTKLNSYADLVTPKGEDTHLRNVELHLTRVSKNLPVPEPDSEIWKWFDGLLAKYDDIVALPPEVQWLFVPNEVSYLTTLWDLPEYENLSVWDTSFTWEELSKGYTWDKELDAIHSDLTWDDAIIIGYFDAFKSEFTQFNLDGVLVAKDW